MFFSEQRRVNDQFTHLSGNVFCAIDIDVTGPIVGHHDIIQICVLPLNNKMTYSKKALPFYIDIKQRHLNNIDKGYMRRNRLNLEQINKTGIESQDAASRLDTWKEKLNLQVTKNIVPLAFDWITTRDYLIDWLGKITFSDIFSPSYRDIRMVANYINDQVAMSGEATPYRNVDIPDIADQLTIDRTDMKRDSLQDCVLIAEIYRRMMFGLY